MCGDLGGAEANVRNVAAGMTERGCAVALLHGGFTDTNMARWQDVFPLRFSWLDDAAACESAAWQPDVVYVHKLANEQVLETLVAWSNEKGIPLVRMVHDHDMYCMRSSRYSALTQTICTRKAGLGCMMRCAIQPSRTSRLPVKFNNVMPLLRQLDLCRSFSRHIVVTRFMREQLVLNDFDVDRGIMPPVPRAAPAEYAARYTEPTILYVGQLIRGKGVHFLIRSLKELQRKIGNV